MNNTKILALLVGFLAFSAVVFASETTGRGYPGNEGTTGGSSVTAVPATYRIGGVTIDTSTEKGMELYRIREQIQLRINQTAGSTKARVRNVHGYQVQAYVHGLLETAELMEGPIGQQVRTVARNMNESVKLMVQAEERVQSRSILVKFFIGADQEAVDEMEQQMNQVRSRITEMEQKLANVSDEAVRAMIREQIQNMEQNLEQIQEKIQSERKIKGLFGFLFRYKSGTGE